MDAHASFQAGFFYRIPETGLRRVVECAATIAAEAISATLYVKRIGIVVRI
jgi:hypothetical protein